MLLDNLKRKRKKTIKHKTQTVFLAAIILTFLIVKLIDLIISNVINPFNILVSSSLFLIYTYFISKFISRLFSYKFVEQVNRMTDVAKAISNSKDLSKRVNISSRDDELKTLEEALNSMLDQLENSFERQCRFVSDASHELRTPVSILKGYLDILSEWGLKDEQILKEAVQSMEEETIHMKNLIENLLFIARADQGQVPLSIHPIRMKPIIEKQISNMYFICGSRKIITQISEDITINADSELIVQMLRALVENSIKYTDENGSITINLFKEKKYVRIDIIDNGIGIPKKDKDNIFERFYRGEEARGKNSCGSGLGLSMVKRIVDMHDGKIEVESEQGKGTKVSLFFIIA